MKKLGILSDTHGLLRPEVLAHLRGCDLILHAGDVGNGSVLEQLRELAPLVVVRGNIDGGPWADNLPMTQTIEVEGHSFFMLHDLSKLRLDPAAAGWRGVIYGHSHQPRIAERDGVLYLNPGSAGPRRFGLPISLALLEVEVEEVRVQLIEVDPGKNI